ncbi:MAG: hypothetical protein L0J45_02005 [Psychroflexus sp.]|nr:hypothetical protein [Psychroflexus sp.]MDN6310062.1 hypothetical protein [Psychroflexus sp.]
MGADDKIKPLPHLLLGGQQTAHWYYDQVIQRASILRLMLYQINFSPINATLPDQLDIAAKLLEKELDFLKCNQVSKWMIANVTLHEVLQHSKHPILSKFDSIYTHIPPGLRDSQIMLIGTKHTMNSDFVKQQFDCYDVNIIHAKPTDQELIDSLRRQFYEIDDQNLAQHIFDHLLKTYPNVDYFVILCTEHAIAADLIDNDKLVNLPRIQCRHF